MVACARHDDKRILGAKRRHCCAEGPCAHGSSTMPISNKRRKRLRLRRNPATPETTTESVQRRRRSKPLAPLGAPPQRPVFTADSAPITFVAKFVRVKLGRAPA